MAEKGYEYGVRTRLDHQDAETNLMQAEGDPAQAKRDYVVALVNLKWVIGKLGENAENQNSMLKAHRSK